MVIMIYILYNVFVSHIVVYLHSAPKPQDSSPHSVATGSHGNMTQAVRAQDNRVPSAISPVVAGPSGLQTENDKESVGRWRNALRDLAGSNHNEERGQTSPLPPIASGSSTPNDDRLE